MIVECKNCKIEFNKSPSQIKRGSNNFCSRSCAATYNNKHAIKRKLSKQCKNCDTLIRSSNTYCGTCWKDMRASIDNMTIEESCLYKNGATNLFTRIRDRARNLYKDKCTKCEVCGYDKHVQVCHIKPINTYPKNTLVSEVNSLSNLAFLCPNHHWELDHDMLDLELVRREGVEPPSLSTAAL